MDHWNRMLHTVKSGGIYHFLIYTSGTVIIIQQRFLIKSISKCWADFVSAWLLQNGGT